MSRVFFNKFPMASTALLPLKSTWRPMTGVATAHWSAIVLDLIVKALLDSINCFRWGLQIKPCPSHVKYCLLMFLDETENWKHTAYVNVIKTKIVKDSLFIHFCMGCLPNKFRMQILDILAMTCTVLNMIFPPRRHIILKLLPAPPPKQFVPDSYRRPAWTGHVLI